ncbi:hypothetical protein B296_00022806 [Ensete ventricosum]|uniref:Uncharacterized protein n=1 Tax=Ensete ventricosum TaxID=4639 RepID=A0A426YLT6_ENSVE|nr:hypothetical protein B296_00022806 [Ensete ventricosum]
MHRGRDRRPHPSSHPISIATDRMAEISDDPDPLISSQRDLSRSVRREAAMIRQPALARSRPWPQPMPEEAPVTITTLPSKLLPRHGWITTSLQVVRKEVLVIYSGWAP